MRIGFLNDQQHTFRNGDNNQGNCNNQDIDEYDAVFVRITTGYASDKPSSRTLKI